MASKDELQSHLKNNFGINKNISQVLSREECDRLLELLYQEPTTVKLVQSYTDKNHSLGRNNAALGGARQRAEQKFATLQAEHLQLERAIASMQTNNKALELKKEQLHEEQQQIEAQIQNLSAQNLALSVQVQTLTTHNDELTTANSQLKKENKDLKNIVDQIRLRLARDTKELLQYEDSEIRKAIIRLFRWTLG